jgi:Na+/melibiose symporter-like transporter
MIFVLLYFTVMVLLSLMEENSTDFNDLGILLLAGVAGAIVLAIAFTLVRLRFRNRKPTTSSFISISSDKE